MLFSDSICHQIIKEIRTNMIIKIAEISLKVYREIASRCSRDNERRFLSSYVSVVQADTTYLM